MTGIRVSLIDDLPQLAAAGASLRLQRLADNLGSSIGRSLLENAFYPNLVGMAAQAEMERQLDALKAQADLDRYLNIAACLGVGHHAAHAILTMQRAYFRPWAEGPPTDLELEEAEAVLHAAAPLFWRTPPPQGRQEPGRLKRLVVRATETLERRGVGQRPWPCSCNAAFSATVSHTKT